MSDATVNAALRRLGYPQDEFTAHSFRSMFSTNANESRLWPPDAIELQLAHVEGNSCLLQNTASSQKLWAYPFPRCVVGNLAGSFREWRWLGV